MLVFGGFYGGEIAKYSNDLFKYNLEKNEWFQFEFNG
jgi:hypothetical protein